MQVFDEEMRTPLKPESKELLAINILFIPHGILHRRSDASQVAQIYVTFGVSERNSMCHNHR